MPSMLPPATALCVRGFVRASETSSGSAWAAERRAPRCSAPASLSAGHSRNSARQPCGPQDGHVRGHRHHRRRAAYGQGRHRAAGSMKWWLSRVRPLESLGPRHGKAAACPAPAGDEVATWSAEERGAPATAPEKGRHRPGPGHPLSLSVHGSQLGLAASSMHPTSRGICARSAPFKLHLQSFLLGTETLACLRARHTERVPLACPFDG